jgi:hypothetical protein
VADIIAAGIMPAGLEMMDNLSIRAAEDFVHAGYPTDAAAILLCELDGANAEVSEQIMAVREVLLKAGAGEVRTAADEAQRLKFWAGRKGAFPAVAASAPITTAWTAPSPGSTWPLSCAASPSCRNSTACGSPTCSTPATATCTPSSCSMPTSPAR